MKNLIKLLILIIGTSFMFQFQQPVFGSKMEQGYANYLADSLSQSQKTDAQLLPVNMGDSNARENLLLILTLLAGILSGGMVLLATLMILNKNLALRVMATIENTFNFFMHARHVRNKVKRFFSFKQTRTTEVMGSE